MPHTPPVYCAVDRPDLDGALALGRALAGAVGGLKLGLEFTTANGPQGVRRMAGLGLPLFLDLKLHDIPNTVAGAVRAAATLGGDMLTVHAPGGRAMLRAAAEAAGAAERPPKILAVTVLTSLSDEDLAAMGIPERALDHALRLADLALASGCDGIVCSPLEVAAMRERFGGETLLVVPGVRPAGPVVDDQRRTLAPAEAIAAGADLLVIGRPITAAADPAAAARAIAAEIAGTRAA
jgi:orotidine-5'-phosphate decarboxylase